MKRMLTRVIILSSLIVSHIGYSGMVRVVVERNPLGPELYIRNTNPSVRTGPYDWMVKINNNGVNLFWEPSYYEYCNNFYPSYPCKGVYTGFFDLGDSSIIQLGENLVSYKVSFFDPETGGLVRLAQGALASDSVFIDDLSVCTAASGQGSWTNSCSTSMRFSLEQIDPQLAADIRQNEQWLKGYVEQIKVSMENFEEYRRDFEGDLKMIRETDFKDLRSENLKGKIIKERLEAARKELSVLLDDIKSAKDKLRSEIRESKDLMESSVVKEGLDPRKIDEVQNLGNTATRIANEVKIDPSFVDGISSLDLYPKEEDPHGKWAAETIEHLEILLVQGQRTAFIKSLAEINDSILSRGDQVRERASISASESLYFQKAIERVQFYLYGGPDGKGLIDKNNFFLDTSAQLSFKELLTKNVDFIGSGLYLRLQATLNNSYGVIPNWEQNLLIASEDFLREFLSRSFGLSKERRQIAFNKFKPIVEDVITVLDSGMIDCSSPTSAKSVRSMYSKYISSDICGDL